MLLQSLGGSEIVGRDVASILLLLTRRLLMVKDGITSSNLMKIKL